jgi:thiopeptide-type bacteriocin biosynthesis protein
MTRHVLNHPPVPSGTRSAIFEPLDFFMLRAPLLPFEQYRALFSHESLDAETLEREALERLAQGSENPLIREAIAIGSLSLLESLPNLTLADNPRKQDQAVKGFLRYLLRMMTRPTPFGLFSGVTYGNLGEQAVMRLGAKTDHRKRTRPDMEWLLKVVQQLEGRPEIVQQLRVQTNGLLDSDGSRMKLPYVNHYGQSSEKTEVSVRVTPAVEFTLETARKPILFQELVDRIHQKFPDTQREKISHFVWQLFQQEFLVCELRPPMTEVDPLQHVRRCLSRLQGVEQWQRELDEIAVQLAEYDRLPLGEGEELFREISLRMKRLADAKHALQVDLALSRQQVELPRAVGEEVARAAEVLWRLSPADVGGRHLESYKKDFLERYGQYREVPLLELLDEDRGLGAPASYTYPHSRRTISAGRIYSETRDAILLQMVNRALQCGEMEVELTEEMVGKLEPVAPDPKQAPISMELYFSLVADSEQAVEQGDYLLFIGGNAGSSGAGKTFGRFVDILGDEFPDHLKRAHEREQKLRPDAVLAELVMVPHTARSSNVMLTTNIRPYAITLGTVAEDQNVRQLPLSDLVVGLHQNSFYVKSRTLNREVIPMTGHMLNMVNLPNVCRFLREISGERVRRWTEIQWGPLEKAPFLPRLRYGKAVLSPATWNIGPDLQPFAPAMNKKEFATAVRKWRKEWKVPRYTYMTFMDHRLLLDLEHPLHVDELWRDFHKLSSGEVLKLTESGIDLYRQVVSGPEGFYLNECVFPLVLRPEHAGGSVPQRTASPLSLRERTHLPGGEWLFCKLYGGSSREDELIGWHLREFCRQVEERELSDLSFYMRYRDPDPHVRLRFHGDPARLCGELLPEVYRWVSGLQAEGLLTRLVIDSYEPEIERYGGPDLIASAERMFAADSRCTAEWIGLQRAGQMRMSRELLAVLSVNDLLEQFGLSLEEKVRWFEPRIVQKEYLQTFRQDRRTYLRLLDPVNGQAALREHPDGSKIVLALNQRSEAVRQYAERVRRAEEMGSLANQFDDLVESVVHLHLNRLLGIDRERERKVMTLTRHALFNLMQMRMNRT